MNVFRHLLLIRLVLSSLAQDLHATSDILVVGLGLLHLRQSVAQADIVVRAAHDFEWLCLFECRHQAWLGREIISWRSLHLLDLPSQLVELIRSPRVQLEVLRQHYAMLQAAVDLLNCLRERAFAT